MQSFLVHLHDANEAYLYNEVKNFLVLFAIVIVIIMVIVIVRFYYDFITRRK